MKKIPIRSDEDDSRDAIQKTESAPEEKNPRRIEVREPEDAADDARGDGAKTDEETSSTRAIEIKISLPSFKQVGNTLKSIPKKIILIIVILAALLGGGYYALERYELLPWQNEAETEDSALQNLAQNPEDLPRGNPDFQTLTPGGEALSEDAWVRISPEGNDPVYAYTDSIGDIEIAVSQQPLPENFKDETEKRINDLAIDFGATEKVSVSGTTVYIGTAGNGPQSVLFSKSNLLILIKSADKVSTNNWAHYVRSLQ